MLFFGVDTALQNTGAVLTTEDGTVQLYSKVFATDEGLRGPTRMLAVEAKLSNMHGTRQDVFTCFEDYFLTGQSTSHMTAELLGVLKCRWEKERWPYCLAHPSKTKKYVVKKKEVTKTEIITYWKDRGIQFPGVPKKDEHDLYDAYTLARIAHLVWELTVKGIQSHHEPRWLELALTDKSGIIPMGLSQTFNYF